MSENLLQQLFSTNQYFDYGKVESPIESILLNHIAKFLDKETQIILQYPVSTISGKFRADIVLKNKEKIVIIECDGKEHHTADRDDWYDEWRDALILIQKKAQVIYRIKGIDIQNNIYKVFAILYNYDKDLFYREYAERIKKFDINENWYKKQIQGNYLNKDDQLISSTVEVKRKELEKDFDNFWLKYILYSLIYTDKNVYQLIDEMSSKHYESKDLIKMINKRYPNLKLENEKQLLTLYKK